MSARELAFSLLQKAQKANQYSNIALDKALLSSALSSADKRLVAILFYGVTEKRITLDYYISALSSKPLGELSPSVLTALRLGLYQLIFLDRIPPHAAINETVSLVPKKVTGFVNAVLRAYTRTPDIALPKKDTDTVRYLSVKYSVCEELAVRLLGIYGQACEEILGGFDLHSRTTLRINTLKTSPQELAGNLDGASLSPMCDTAIYTDGAVREMFGFEDGLFFVQDIASQLCVKAVDARAGETVIDMCSAPGSKSFGMAIDMKNRGRILSFDLHQNKLSLIESTAKRLGIDIISTAAHDAREPISELFEKADRVLCDVPCSGFGVLAKKPELRYKNPAESARLPEIQLAILENASQYVKHGGVLVYSTCTILPEENEENIRVFLKKHPDFSLCAWSAGGLDVQSGYITLFPHIHKTDGFFIAKLIRR